VICAKLSLIRYECSELKRKNNKKRRIFLIIIKKEKEKEKNIHEYNKKNEWD